MTAKHFLFVQKQLHLLIQATHWSNRKKIYVTKTTENFRNIDLYVKVYVALVKLYLYFLNIFLFGFFFTCQPDWQIKVAPLE